MEAETLADGRLVLSDVKLIFRNFSGRPSQYNQEGTRNFCVLLNTDVANDLKSKGWNVRFSEVRNEGDEPQAYMGVAVSFEHYPPTVTLVTSKNQTLLKETDIGMLDWADVEKADLIIRPYSWDVSGKKGIKAYLKSMYVTIEEDPLAEKYSEVPSEVPVGS